MPDIFLLISDISLRDAVAEQIKNAKLGEAHSVDSLQTLVKQEGGKTSTVVIIDQPELEKQTEALQRSFGKSPESPVLLLLGEAPDSEVIAESFSKPFRLGHLVTRLRYYLETVPLLRSRIVAFGPFRLEPQNRRILREDSPDPIRLTEKETALLIFLTQKTKPATRKEILADVWGYDENIDTHTLETHIYQLRRKLDREGETWLINEGGSYRLAGLQK